MRAGLLWVTYRKDLEWFKFSARSYKRFATGFEWAKCVVPDRDVELFSGICAENGILLCGYKEWEDKGFLHHMAMKCYGDLHFPEADVIFHMDGDTVFGSHCTPAKWLREGKILMPYTDYVHFLEGNIPADAQETFMGFTGRKIDFNQNQYIWKFAASFALGWEATRECMSWMPIAHARETYAKTREIIKERFPGQGFEGYLQTCRNSFPQSFCEFNTLGEVAFKFFPDKYKWIDCHTQGRPFSNVVFQSWSHGGLDRPHSYSPEMDVLHVNSPRKLFEYLKLF